jgi:hypothetical protein
MKPKKQSIEKGLTDKELVDKYEAGKINLKRVIMPMLNKPIVSKHK